MAGHDDEWRTVLLLVIRRGRRRVAARGGAGAAAAEQVPSEEAGRPRVGRRLGELAPLLLVPLLPPGPQRGVVDALGPAPRVLSLKKMTARRVSRNLVSVAFDLK